MEEFQSLIATIVIWGTRNPILSSRVSILIASIKAGDALRNNFLSSATASGGVLIRLVRVAKSIDFPASVLTGVPGTPILT
jgi:adenine-specific DNA methylase